MEFNDYFGHSADRGSVNDVYREKVFKNALDRCVGHIFRSGYGRILIIQSFMLQLPGNYQ